MRKSGRSEHALIVGASLAGLMAALTLARAGIKVSLLERSADTGRTGAALEPGPMLLERLTGRAGNTELDGHSIQTWTAVHAHLRAAVERDPQIAIHDGVGIVQVEQDAGAAWAIAEDGRVFTGDLLVGADGYRSVVRTKVAPQKPNARFAGYMIWIGISREADLYYAGLWPTGTLYDEAHNYVLLGSPIPAEDGALRHGDRRISWAMYDNTRNELLRSSGAVLGSVVQRTLLPKDLPEDLFSNLRDEADLWAEPWRSAILDCVNRRAIIGTPIAEYLPDRLANGRLCLVGDAAHVPTPMTGNGFAASRDDAIALGEQFRNNGDIFQALRAYEAERLPIVRRLVKSGQQFSQSYAANERAVASA
jgi:2-polyprenyl-6-methoxyphenol hydroxylase-like FAD-dependent oxidoreductase